MSNENPQEYQEILHQIHSDIFLERLRDYVAQDGDVPDKVAFDLSDLVRRLVVKDSSIDRKDIEKFLKDDEIRDQLILPIRQLINSQSKQET